MTFQREIYLWILILPNLTSYIFIPQFKAQVAMGFK